MSKRVHRTAAIAALLWVVAAEAKPLDPALFTAKQGPPSCLAPCGRGQVWYGEWRLFDIVANAGGLTAMERARIIARERLAVWAKDGKLTADGAIRMGRLNGEWVLFVDKNPDCGPCGGNLLVTIDWATARAFGGRPATVACYWRERLAQLAAKGYIPGAKASATVPEGYQPGKDDAEPLPDNQPDQNKSN